MSEAEVILVHGAWHGGWCWSALQTELGQLGVSSFAVDLPGHGQSELPLGDLHGDARFVVDQVCARSGPVVLVGHSYGGAVITEAAASCPNVIHLVYIAAFVPDVGESINGLTRSLPNAPSTLAQAIVIGERGVSTIDPGWAVETFYGSAPCEAAHAAAARLEEQAYATFKQTAEAAAWRSTPSTYVRCTLDNAVPFAHQVVMAERCGEVRTLDSDHTPFVSMARETAAIIAALDHIREDIE